MRKEWNGPRMIYGETIASWTYRCAHNPACEVLTTKDLEGLFVVSSYSDVFSDVPFPDANIDFNISLTPPKALIDCYKISEQATRRLFGPEGRVVLDPEFCSAYCPDCLKKDVAHFGLPAWRRSWCYVHAPFCIIHKRLLSVVSDTDCTKACSAFLQDDEESFASDQFQIPGSYSSHLRLVAI